MGTAWNSRTPCPAPNPGPPAAPARQVEIAKGFRCGNTPECLRRCPRRVLRRAGRSRPRFSLVERHTMPNGQRQHRDALTSSGQPGQRSAWQSTTAPPAGPVICWPAPPPAPGRPALTTSAQAGRAPDHPASPRCAPPILVEHHGTTCRPGDLLASASTWTPCPDHQRPAPAGHVGELVGILASAGPFEVLATVQPGRAPRPRPPAPAHPAGHVGELVTVQPGRATTRPPPPAEPGNPDHQHPAEPRRRAGHRSAW